jgi:cyclopropane fatty-acyl-phospholipid synthase-like methyltransferase
VSSVLDSVTSPDIGRKDFIPGYFSMLDWVLNAKGAACFQVITMPESRFERCTLCLTPSVRSLTFIDQREVDFIQKWIFPGGFLPSVSFVAEAVQKGGHNRLIIDSVSNIGVSSVAVLDRIQANTAAALRTNITRMEASLPAELPPHSPCPCCRAPRDDC